MNRHRAYVVAIFFCILNVWIFCCLYADDWCTLVFNLLINIQLMRNAAVQPGGKARGFVGSPWLNFSNTHPATRFVGWLVAPGSGRQFTVISLFIQLKKCPALLASPFGWKITINLLICHTTPGGCFGAEGECLLVFFLVYVFIHTLANHVLVQPSA